MLFRSQGIRHSVLGCKTRYYFYYDVIKALTAALDDKQAKGTEAYYNTNFSMFPAEGIRKHDV